MKKWLEQFFIFIPFIHICLICPVAAETEMKKEENSYWETHRLEGVQEQEIVDQHWHDRELERKRLEDDIQRKRLERRRQEQHLRAKP
jgi:hypothetical protein